MLAPKGVTSSPYLSKSYLIVLKFQLLIPMFISFHNISPNPAGTQHQNDVISTSMRRDHVASTLIRRHFNVLCPLGRFNWRQKLHTLFEIFPNSNTVLTCMLLSGHYVGIVDQALVRQMGRYQLSRTEKASWEQRALPSMDLHTTLLQY